MRYSEVHIENGQIVEDKVVMVDQTKLTSDCWLIQFNGAEACSKCEFLNKPRLCGAMEIRKKLGVPEPITRKKKIK